jgi:hypothetical protein
MEKVATLSEKPYSLFCRSKTNKIKIADGRSAAITTTRPQMQMLYVANHHIVCLLNIKG